MALSTRRSKKDEEEILDDETELEAEDAAEEKSVAPAVSDRRRRRMLAQGLAPDAAVTSTKPKRAEAVERVRDDEKKGKDAEGSRFFLRRWIDSARSYFRDVRSELNKVAWPTREETERLTRIVLVVTIATSLVLGAISFLFGLLATGITDANIGTIAGLVTIAIIVVVAFLWLIRDRIFPNYE